MLKIVRYWYPPFVVLSWLQMIIIVPLKAITTVWRWQRNVSSEVERLRSHACPRARHCASIYSDGSVYNFVWNYYHTLKSYTSNYVVYYDIIVFLFQSLGAHIDKSLLRFRATRFELNNILLGIETWLKSYLRPGRSSVMTHHCPADVGLYH